MSKIPTAMISVSKENWSRSTLQHLCGTIPMRELPIIFTELEDEFYALCVLRFGPAIRGRSGLEAIPDYRAFYNFRDELYPVYADTDLDKINIYVRLDRPGYLDWCTAKYTESDRSQKP